MNSSDSSSYTYWIMDRTRHKIGNYLNDRKTHKMTNEPLFERLNTLESTREVELLQSKIEHRESIVLEVLYCSMQNGED